MWPFNIRNRILFRVETNDYYTGKSWTTNEAYAERFTKRNAEALRWDFAHIGHLVTILKVR